MRYMKILSWPVELAAVYEHKKPPTPVKFRYKDPDGKIIAMTVDNISDISETNIAGVRAIIYKCNTDDINYELKFIVNSCKWELYRM